jgi:hypothetical protein
MKAERDRSNPRLVYLVPERGLERATKRFLTERTNHCVKCGSAFVSHEPLFVHCHYCGALVRVAAASLLDQELFEIRSGVRLAS